MLRLRPLRMRSDRRRVRKKMNMSNMSCPPHATAISVHNTCDSKRYLEDALEAHTHRPS